MGCVLFSFTELSVSWRRADLIFSFTHVCNTISKIFQLTLLKIETVIDRNAIEFNIFEALAFFTVVVGNAFFSLQCYSIIFPKKKNQYIRKWVQFFLLKSYGRIRTNSATFADWIIAMRYVTSDFYGYLTKITVWNTQRSMK